MFSKKTLSVLAVSIFASSGVFAASQQIEGRPGVPQVQITKPDGTKTTGVPQTLDQVPARYCPAKNPTGFDGSYGGKGTTAEYGWSCSQLHLSGNNIYSLFDKAYNDSPAPGAKNLAYDYLRAMVDKKIAEGMESAAAWGQVNKISQELHGSNVVGNYQNSFGTLGYGNYDDPPSALMFDNVNRCGCVTEFEVGSNVNLYLEKEPGGSTEMPASNNVQDGCSGVTAFFCAKTLARLEDKNDYWGKHQYNKSFQDLSKSCFYWWNTLINNTYNQKYNNTTDPNDPNYTEICDPIKGGARECRICKVDNALKAKYQNLPEELFCEGSAFVGPGLISYSGKDKDGNALADEILVSYDGATCGVGEGKIDIVAQ